MIRLEEARVSIRHDPHAAHALGHGVERSGLHAGDLPRASAAESLSATRPLFRTMTDAKQDHVVALPGAVRG